MTVVMLVSMLPVSAMAALLDNDPAYNQEILEQLKGIVGSEEEAERYYAVLEQYGLLDEDGSVKESWTIYMDGEEVTLDEIVALYDDPDCDLDRYVMVDGTAITLGELKTILEIEEYIEYLRQTYFSGGEWTQAHLDSLDDLLDQINNEGIMLYSANSGTNWPSGVSHEARVSISGPTVSGTTATFTAKLTGAVEGQTVTFKYAALSGSQTATGSGTVTFNSGETQKTFSVSIPTMSTGGGDPVRSNTNLVYYVKLDNIQNALFSNNEKAMTVKGTTSKTTDISFGAFTVKGKGTVDSSGLNYTPYTHTFTDTQKKLIDWGIVNQFYVEHNSDESVSVWGKEHGEVLSAYTNGKTLLSDVDFNQAEVLYGIGKSVMDYEGYDSADPERSGVYVKTEYTEYGIEVGGQYYQFLKRGCFPQEKFDAASKGELKFYYYGEGWQDMDTQYFEWKTLTDEKEGKSGLTSDTIKLTSAIFPSNVLCFAFWPDVDDTWMTVSSWTASGFSNAITDTDAKCKIVPLEATAVFSNSGAPTVTSVSAPAGTYYPGQVVPVTVTFSEPVNAATAKVKFTGSNTEYKAAEGTGYSNKLTFAYTVQDVDNASLTVNSVTATDSGNNTLSNHNPNKDVGVTLQTPNKEDAIAGVTAAISGAAHDTMTVSVDISSNSKLTAWMSSDQDNDGKLYATGMSVSLDGGNTMHNLYFKGDYFKDGLTATIPLEMNIGESSLSHTVELFIDNELVISRYATAEQTPVVFIEEGDLAASIDIGDYEFENDDNPVIYVQSDMPTIRASFTLTGSGYSFGNVNNTAVAGTDAAATADFVWASSNTAVANIDASGKITPTGTAGSTTITLTARNGGVEGRAVTATATYTVNTVKKDTLQFAAGLTPFLTIPNDKLHAADGQDVTVYWSSNLCDKNGEKETVFTVTVTRNGETVYSEQVTGTASNPAASVTIPGSALEYDYDGGSNDFIVTVSATYDDVEYKDTAAIGMEALPAKATLGKLDSYYILDTVSTLPIEWAVRNLANAADVQNQNDIFRFQITRNDTDVPTDITLNLENGAAGGFYELPIANITKKNNDPTSYRDVYTVTLQAKNGTDSTWSYDSFLLYVYDEDALKIMVDGETANSVTMSNIDAISAMSQDEILALKRDIYLKNIISVNYGEYAWTEVADQIAWKSSNNSVATLNYQQGTLYENIERFTYVSYRPTTELGLSGLSDGNAVISAIHKLTGMTETLNVTVETLKDKLYLFQCYPQAVTTLTYTNGDGEKKTITSDETGAAAIYEESGIAGDVYCSAEVDGITYLGIFYKDSLKTGEGDWTELERYPCNNLNLRRAAYAYIYLKNPDDTPYTGSITFRGGVYVNGEYKSEALFALNNDANVNRKGDEDNTVSLGSNGKLTVTMDQTQWGLDGGAVSAGDQVEYVFQVETTDNSYYPILYTIDATANQDDYVGSGEAIVNFRDNPDNNNKQHPFIAAQTSYYTNYTTPSSLLGFTGAVGPNDTMPEAVVTTSVMWWGEDMTGLTPSLQLRVEDGLSVSDGRGEYTLENSVYPFSDIYTTEYTVKLNESSLDGVVKSGEAVNLRLEYYRDGSTKSLEESMTFQLTNMLGVGNVEEAEDLDSILKNMGAFGATDAKGTGNMDVDDDFVTIAMDLIAKDSYTGKDGSTFSIQLVPTSDPTKFMGLIQVNAGNMSDAVKVTGYENFNYKPGVTDLMSLVKSPVKYGEGIAETFSNAAKGKGERNIAFKFEGYMESLVYFDKTTKDWRIQVLSGGFGVGGGVSYTWNWNTMVGPIPFTASLTIGGNVEVGMDALTVAYLDKYDATKLGNDFLTELRIYLYLRFFAGVGIDYSVIAFKLGIFGQIDIDMRFQWMNRPYLGDDEDGVMNIADGGTDDVLNGQNFKINGTIGLEFVMRILFISYEKVLWSQSFSLLDKSTGEWNKIQSNWAANQQALQSVISGLLNTGAVSVYRLQGQQMLSLNLAPTMEDRSYLDSEDFYRQWGDGGFSLFALDANNALANLQSSSYPYANPVVSGDGQIVGYLSDMDSSDVEATRAAFAVMDGDSYTDRGAIDNNGYGDSQISLSGTESFAVAAWTRQTVSIAKDAGAVLTADDQMMMMNGTEVYAGVYTDSGWTSTRLTENGSPDMAPVVATNGTKAIVAWRAVSTSGEDGNVTNFDEKDTILYRIYDGTAWGETETLYNGTSGAVKAIVAAMLDDGTAAVAYTLDGDGEDTTLSDKEIYYAVVNNYNGEVVRNVRATNDAYLDENPQLTAVEFPSEEYAEHFVLGWYTEQAVSSDSAAVLDAGEIGTGNTATSDIRLIDFTAEGVPSQLLPDSISKVADADDVTITSNFRFTKNATTINDLSILWVERAEEMIDTDEYGFDLSTVSAERDILKGVKFYTYGQNSELIRFTGAIDVAEMGDGTLIDHFDSYVSDAENNEIKAVILGTTYGAGGIDGTVTKTVTLDDGEGTQAQVTVPTQTTSMYTATETYADKIAVPALLADYETVRKGAVTQIQFTVENNGIHAIKTLTFQVGNNETVYDDLNLLPGDSIQLYADYTVPTDKIVDPEYTVTAEFDESSGASGSAQTKERQGLRQVIQHNQAGGTVHLNLPDVEITKAEIVEEVDGKRVISVKLNNASDADLANPDANFKVKVGFYTDATYEEPIKTGYGLDSFIIRSSEDLAMIDDGGYSKQVTFNINSWLAAEQSLTEIPDTGITVYIKTEMLDSDDNVQGEPLDYNNYANVVCENLEVRTGEDAIVTSTLTKEDGGSTVTVNVQNTRLSETSTGNLIVTLLDAKGNVLEQQQSYTGEDGNTGLITLSGEAKVSSTFTFTSDKAKNAVSAQVAYTDLILENEGDAPNTDLNSLSFSNIPGVTLDSFVKDESGTYRADVSVTSLTSTAVMAVAASGKAAIQINDGTAGGNAISETVTLSPGRENTITITVTNGDVTNTYILTVQNVRPGGSGGATSYSVDVAAAEHGSISVAPRSASRGDTVTITVTPDKGYKLETLTVTDKNGLMVELTNKGDGKYTFKMPGSKVTVKATFMDENAMLNFFVDVSADAYYYDAVLWAAEAGITSGTSATTFSPNNPCTRAQMATFLWRAAGSPEPVGTPHTFTDVPADAYYAKAVQWAYEQGITGGTSATTYSPDEPCTRGQMATFLWRNAGSQAPVNNVNQFADVPSTAYYATAVQWAYEQKITAGTSATTFSPDDPCTRAQMVTFLYRFFVK